MEDFINLLIKNLKKNNFPNKKVSFDLEGMYERAENKKLSLNDVLDEIKKRGIHHTKKGDKIIFFSGEQSNQDPNAVPSVNPDFLAQAKEMMDNMSSDELDATQSFVQERMKNMTEEERKHWFDQIKNMGLM